METERKGKSLTNSIGCLSFSVDIILFQSLLTGIYYRRKAPITNEKE
jgi:hypothetical protein